MEELKDGNWERECIEEDCNANEAYEVVDDEEQGDRLFDLLNDCKEKHNTRESQSNCVENGMPAVTRNEKQDKVSAESSLQTPVNCGPDYFRPGAEWPLQNMLVGAQSGKTVRLCQNNYGKDHYFATLFNTDTNLPVYSAIKISRTKNGKSYPRPDKFIPANSGPKPRPKSVWLKMCKGLCGTNTPPSDTSFYCNLDEVKSPNECD
ncbi:Oidioi.mRNA.OKI2018_I69.chr2.g5010.t1.cds [Oikopleura dioica]|uniref:Oidioi.mRNA.OKI2018_I69.chr2.g5010.t1.cds n=1 Tax=Oikopleura dioica TaxID=34765 RepID=A0ABN7SZK3_OIKDI|nr:Oidioi.mRNA.OKI2018_I69.chr2.g5010.t1.cds [Oikopleura dioica]